jgi:hypothetical protein
MPSLITAPPLVVVQPNVLKRLVDSEAGPNHGQDGGNRGHPRQQGGDDRNPGESVGAVLYRVANVLQSHDRIRLNM